MKALALIFALLFLVACADPLGMTERQRVRSNAYVEAARVQAEAQKTVAAQETVRTGLVVAVLPWLAIIIVGGAVVGVVVWWQGRIHLARVERAPASMPALPPSSQMVELRQLAARQGYGLEIEGSIAYLIDAGGQRVGRRQLTTLD